MCLKLNNNAVETAKALRSIASKNSFVIKGYKSLIDRGNETFESAYHNHTWHLNEKSESTRRTVQLSFKELKEEKVDKGFHFYTDYDTAVENLIDNRVLVEFDIEVKDLVALGKNSFQGADGLVATAATPRAVLEI